jgi:NDP-sugar pyrophosphorylase family protein
MGRENRAPSNGQRSLLLTNLAVCGASVIQRLPDLIAQTGNFSKQLLDVLKLYHEHGGATYMAETNWILPIEADYDLLTVNRLMLDEELDNHILSEVPASVHLIPPVRIDPHVSVGQGARIGPHVYLEAGCSVGAQAVVRDALVLQNATVPAGKTVRDVIVASRVQVRNPG